MNRMIGAAQIILSVVFTLGYFGILAAFLFGLVRPPVDWRDALMTLLGLLTAGELLILQFWFSRERSREGA